jgi:BirA family biotin operon repressor/biotin-[acetyl-CoA-carboxylase] ligase
MRAQRAVPAGLLSSATKSNVSPLSVAGLWMRLVSRIFFCYVEEIDAKGKNAWRSLAERHLAFLGQTVLLTDGPDEQERHTGILEGLDDFGGLRLRNRKGTNSFLSGSLRLDRPPMQP